MSGVQKRSRRRKQDLDTRLEEAEDVIREAAEQLSINVKQLIRDVGFRPHEISSCDEGIDILYMTKECPVTALVGVHGSYIVRWTEATPGTHIFRIQRDGKHHVFKRDDPVEVRLSLLAEWIREQIVEQGQDSDLDE